MKTINKKIIFLKLARLFITVNCFVVISLSAFSKSKAVLPQDSLEILLSSLPLDSFVAKPIDSFLLHIPQNYDTMLVMGSDNPHYARILLIEYAGGYSIMIYVKQFRFMNPYSLSFSWNTLVFRKEDISSIEIYRNTRCLNGC